MRLGKSVILSIPTNLCKCGGERGIAWLTRLFNNVFKQKECQINGEKVLHTVYARIKNYLKLNKQLGYQVDESYIVRENN